MKNLLKISIWTLLAISGPCFGMQLCMVSPEFGGWISNVERKIEDAFGGESLPNLTDEKILEMSSEQLEFFVQNSEKAKEKINAFFEKQETSFSDISLAYLCAGPYGKNIDFLMKKIRYSNPYSSFVKGSPTAGHFGRIFLEEAHSFSLQKWLGYEWLGYDISHCVSNNFDIRSCLLKGVLAQKRETKKGYFGYFHAKNSSFFVPQFVFAHLLELYYNKPIDKEAYWALRFGKPGTNLPFLDGEDIVQVGPKSSDRCDVIPYKHFMNCSLFNNSIDEIGSSSLAFFRNNDNDIGIKKVIQGLEMLFAMFDWKEYFLRHQEEFQEIERLAKSKKNQCGTLLLHVFDEMALKQFVYVAKPYGWKNNNIHINGTQTTDVQTIYNTMTHAPHFFDSTLDLDQHEYVFVQTEDHPTDKDKLGSLNPFHKGIKTYHFTVEDMSDVKQKIADVFIKIKQEMQQDKLDNIVKL